MSERRIFRPGVSKTERRKEWVVLIPAHGDEPEEGVWVWGLQTCDSLAIIERATMGGVVQDSGVGRARMLQYQIMLSCYDSDGATARRVFSDADIAPINEGSWEAFSAVVEAINRVNGKDATESELLRDFSPAMKEPSLSAS